ncbi:MAG: EamA family transporter [Alphaproteobacteria bacterium]|nr:MAG: EamA family transporter [Alphaproteobacteria bacterium]
MSKVPLTGAVYGLASALLFGVSTPFAKLLLGAVDPWLLAGLLYLGSGLGLYAYWLVAGVSKHHRAEARLSRTDLPWLAGAIAVGGVAGPVLLMVGLSSTSASSASLLLNLEGLATMAIAWGVYRENADRRIVIGALAILAGAILVSWQGNASGFEMGALAIAAACLAWGIDNNLTRKVSNADPVQIAALKGLAAGATNLVLALAMGANFPPLTFVAAAGAVGLLGYGVSLVLFVLALRHVGAARTGAYFSVAPFAGALVSIALFREPVTLQLGLAALLMGLGIYLHVTEQHEHAHVHEPLEHEHAHVHDEHHHHEHGETDPPGEPHSHRHRHDRLVHSHPHFPDLHHAHNHA